MRVIPFVILLATACTDPTSSAPAARVENVQAPATTPAPTGTEHLTVDRARSSVGFTGAKVTMSHDGHFDQFAGTIDLDPAHVENSRVNITIQMASIQIEPEQLHQHIQSPDLFDVAQFPTATFESTHIVAGGEGGTHTITGNLTMHGRTHGVTFPATIEVSAGDVHARAEFSVNRHDWGIDYPGMPDNLIRDNVVIRFDVHAPRS